jgi:tripartite-type tricarboxylate transporter receptor subunit TctC
LKNEGGKMKVYSKWIGVISILLATTAYGAWPDRPVKIVVPYGPGGGADTFARPLAAKLSEQLGSPFVIDNKAGAGGTIGVQFAAKSAPDGYTFVVGAVHQAMSESLYPNRGYDFDKDFVPVGLTAVVPNVLVINPKLPFKTAGELITYAKDNPDKLTYCSSGNGTSQHVIAELFKSNVKVKMLHIPHKGTAAAMTTFLSGNCDLMFDGMGTSASQINAGNMRALAVTTAKRSPNFPNIPTMKEAGGPDMDVGTWYGWFAPVGTPREIILRMNKELAIALQSPDIKDIWKAQGAEAPAIPLDKQKDFVRSEINRWTQVNKQVGVAID